MRKKTPAPPPPTQPGKREKTRSSLFRRTESSKSFQDLEGSGQDLTLTQSREEQRFPRSELESPLSKRVSRISESTDDVAARINGVRPESYQPAAQTSHIPSHPQPGQQNMQPATSTVIRDIGEPPTSMTNQTRQSDSIVPSIADVSTPEESSRNLKIQDRPIEEDASEARLAMDNMANQLRVQAQTSALNRAQGSFRGRREVRNTVFMPGPVEVGSLSASSSVGANSVTDSNATPLTANTGSTLPTTIENATTHESPLQMQRMTTTESSIPEDAPSTSLLSDGQLSHSAQSTGAAVNHPDLTEAGLQASIVETVSTWFSDSTSEAKAQDTQSLVVGEVALTYNHASEAASSQTHETVRLRNFHVLEKCAQNPAFVTASNTSPEPGTYNIALHTISRSQPTVAFKYQLHLPEQQASMYSPILIEQAWQILDGQAQVIILYSLNPAFQPVSTDAPSDSARELNLKNVQFTVSVDSRSTDASAPANPRALNAQMMPSTHAVFKKRTGSVIFKFPELKVTTTHERLLVRFIMEDGGVAKRGGVELKFNVPDLLASALEVERMQSASRSTETDPFADEGELVRRSAEGVLATTGWQRVPSTKMLVSGRYTSA